MHTYPYILYVALLCLLWAQASVAQNVSGLALNTSACQGIFDFSVNSTNLQETEANVATYDSLATVYLELSPTWITEGCTRAIRKIQCMLAYDTPLGSPFPFPSFYFVCFVLAHMCFCCASLYFYCCINTHIQTSHIARTTAHLFCLNVTLS